MHNDNHDSSGKTGDRGFKNQILREEAWDELGCKLPSSGTIEGSEMQPLAGLHICIKSLG